MDSIIPPKKKGLQRVEDVPYGMYVWRCADGEVLGDGDGNVMNVFLWDRKDYVKNEEAKKALSDAARYYGYPEGKAEWWSGKRQIDDEELQHQQARERAGLVADPLDMGALRDEAKGMQVRK